ncbi:hypothetical protein M0812_27663 [Anaeramoeba flamelloides]|uniref:Uncharacterized protein n=1 Tax=Anaeramoeba flamelloides TaxID=1746091 RepID=A0AAV7Y627_9EUKA|nr:hypothetical protein M0812_27663 [Anaeramoeba flamelloides]
MTLEFYPLLWDFGEYLDSHVLPKELFRADHQAKKFVSRCFPESLSNSPQLNRYLELIQRMFIQNGAFICPTTKKSSKKSNTLLCKKFYLSEVWSDILRKDTFDSDFSLSDTDSEIDSDFEKYFDSESKLKYPKSSSKKYKNKKLSTKNHPIKKSIENTRANRTIGVLGFRLMKLLQTRPHSRENLAEKTEFSKQRVCTVLSIYKLLNLVVEDPKENVLYWNSEQSLLIPDLQKYLKSLILARNYKRKLAKKVLFLSKKLREKYQKKKIYQSRCDDLIGLVQKKVCQSSNTNTIDLKFKDYPKNLLPKIQKIKNKLEQFKKKRVHFTKVGSKKKSKKFSTKALNKSLTEAKCKSQGKFKGEWDGKVKSKSKIISKSKTKSEKKNKIKMKIMNKNKNNRKSKSMKKKKINKLFSDKKLKKGKSFSGHKLYQKHSKSFQDYSELRNKKNGKKKKRDKKYKEKRFGRQNFDQENKKEKLYYKKKNKNKNKNTLKKKKKRKKLKLKKDLGKKDKDQQKSRKKVQLNKYPKKRKTLKKYYDHDFNSDPFSDSFSDSLTESFTGSLTDFFTESFTDSLANSFSDSLSDIQFSALTKKTVQCDDFEDSEESLPFEASNPKIDQDQLINNSKVNQKELKETKLIQNNTNNKIINVKVKNENENGNGKGNNYTDADDCEYIYKFDSDEDTDQVDVIVDIFLDEKLDQNHQLAKMLQNETYPHEQLKNGPSPMCSVDSIYALSDTELIEGYDPESGLYCSDLFESSVTTFYTVSNKYEKGDCYNKEDEQNDNDSANKNKNSVFHSFNYDTKEEENDFSLDSSLDNFFFENPIINDKKKLHSTTPSIEWENESENDFKRNLNEEISDIGKFV